ncbi:DUF3598 family protein [Altericista sp. CCNU0014]|uniref:DUF3598 family protein n=1 Tax=Altericista sp. CCNU0014 TaxID=3082949 RepID=UPI00384C1C92
MAAQWQGLLQNLGTWTGSFTKLSPAGVWLQDTPSEVVLRLSEDGQTVFFTLQREASPEVALQFNYPGPGLQVPFFENGCFSQGSLQHAPQVRFGAEFALIEGDRRLRLVQLFEAGAVLTDLTLIRECRAGNEAESPPLTADALVGVWEGEAVTLYADNRSPNVIQTHLAVEREGDRLTQALQFGSHRIQSSARIDGNCLHFNEGAQPMQLLCLPGGASALFPQQIQPRTPFAIEAGWLVEPRLRKRMVRSYGDRGEWVSITLVTERKID